MYAEIFVGDPDWRNETPTEIGARPRRTSRYAASSPIVGPSIDTSAYGDRDPSPATSFTRILPAIAATLAVSACFTAAYTNRHDPVETIQPVDFQIIDEYFEPE